MESFNDYVLKKEHYQATTEAVEFILAHNLAKGFAEITAKMRENLTSMTGIQIVVIKDPDCDCDPELALRAIFPGALSDAQIDAEMDRFDEYWWLDNTSRWNFAIEVHAGSID